MIRTRSYLKDHRGVLIAGLALLSMTSMPRASWAQWLPNGANIYYNGGSVGIGTMTPQATLDAHSHVGAAFAATSAYGQIFLSPYAGVNYMESGNADFTASQLLYFTGYNGLSGTFAFNGSVGIGTTNPVHQLQVAGTIGAEEILVTSTGADYVFEPGYRLRPLSEVAGYIQANHHLPDIPSADEVKQKGMGLGEMQAKLLAKVEELTLHMIQQDKENRELRDQMNQQTKENQELRERLSRLEKVAASDSTPVVAK
jgi:hypothetical protein